MSFSQYSYFFPEIYAAVWAITESLPSWSCLLLLIQGDNSSCPFLCKYSWIEIFLLRLSWCAIYGPPLIWQTLAVHNCFKDAQRIAKELHGSFSNDPDKIVELRRIEQVAEHNSVALNLLCRLGTLEPSLKISFEFIHHPHFAVASVKRSWWSQRFW